MDYIPVSAREAMNTQIQLSNTAHQREVADLQAAGLNPVLSAHGSGASTPSIQNDSLSEISDFLGTINSALDLAKMSIGSGSKGVSFGDMNAKELGAQLKDFFASGLSGSDNPLRGLIDSIPDKGNTGFVPNSVWKYLLGYIVDNGPSALGVLSESFNSAKGNVQGTSGSSFKRVLREMFGDYSKMIHSSLYDFHSDSRGDYKGKRYRSSSGSF